MTAQDSEGFFYLVTSGVPTEAHSAYPDFGPLLPRDEFSYTDYYTGQPGLLGAITNLGYPSPPNTAPGFGIAYGRLAFAVMFNTLQKIRSYEGLDAAYGGQQGWVNKEKTVRLTGPVPFPAFIPTLN